MVNWCYDGNVHPQWKDALNEMIGKDLISLINYLFSRNPHTDDHKRQWSNETA